MKYRDNTIARSVDTLIQEAAKHFQNGDLATAGTLARSVLAMNPDHPDGNHLLGIIAIQYQQYESAIQFFEWAIRNNPHQVMYFNSLGLALHRSGHLQEALDACDQALKLKPRLADTHNNRSLLLRELGRLDEALAAADRAVKLKPQFTAAHYNRVHALRDLRRQEEALDACDRLIRMNPRFAEAHNLRGILLKELNREQEALAAHEQAIQLNPYYAEAHNNRGIILLNHQQSAEAEDAFNEAIKCNPIHAAAHYNLGLVLIKLGRNEAAVAASQRAIDLNPESVEAHYNLGLVLKNLGRMEEALGACARAVHLDTDSAEAHGNLGTVLFNLGRREEALSSYDRAIQIKSDFAEVYECRGSVLMELGRQDEACESFQTALEFNPQLITSTYSLATLGLAETPSQSPKDYVVGLFDSYAGRFDQHLVEVLRYRAPEQLYEAVSWHIDIKAAVRSLDILDLGCGTGLCGVAFSELARTLVGVDLAPLMIAQARTRNLYTTLIQGEICDILERESGSCNLIVSADVFIYMGDLEKVFALAKEHLSANGLFAFSIELHEGSEEYVLRSTGRYAQSTEYIKRLASGNALDILSDTPVTLRYQGDLPIAGRVMVLRRSGD